MVHYPRSIIYSEKYSDDYYEYRHVILPKKNAELANIIMMHTQSQLLAEYDWRRIGVTQSRGWQHYMTFIPEPHVLLFRRPCGTDPTTGIPPRNWKPPLPNCLKIRYLQFLPSEETIRVDTHLENQGRINN